MYNIGANQHKLTYMSSYHLNVAFSIGYISKFKENLAADVRVTTERRLKSLEGDLARAERAKTERAMAVRYHKVSHTSNHTLQNYLCVSRSNSLVSRPTIDQQSPNMLQRGKRFYGRLREPNEHWRMAWMRRMRNYQRRNENH